jgi:glucose/mannose transport system permease protein
MATAVPDFRTRLQDWLPKLVLAPSLAVTLLFVYGFILFTVVLSFTGSRMLPRFTSIFASLYIVICTVIGLTASDLPGPQDTRRRACCDRSTFTQWHCQFIVTGTAWKWFLDPGIGLDSSIVQQWGWESRSTFNWIKDGDMAIYTIVIAAVWQTSGFVMAMFLAGLRGIDNEILKAAQIDGASNWQLYRRIVIPLLRPAFLSAFVILSPPGDQVLRPYQGNDRWRPRPRDRDAGNLHVFLHLYPQRDGQSVPQVGGNHADDHRGDHGPLPLRRAEGEEGMSVATQDTAVNPRAAVTRAFIYLHAAAFCAVLPACRSMSWASTR